MNNDLISRSKVIEELNYLKHIGYDNSGVMKLQNMEIQRCISVIEDAPAVGLKTEFLSQRSTGKTGLPFIERPRGKWIYKFDRLECPFCGMSIDEEVHWLYSEEFKFNFCPNCGADMRQSNESAD